MQEQITIWRYYQTEGVSSFDSALPRYLFLARKCRSLLPVGARIVNIGLGSGQFDRMLRGLGFSSMSVDPDSESVARAHSLGLECVQGVAEALPLDSQSADLVVMAEVFEHLSPGQRSDALSEITRVLRPGGALIGTTPYAEVLAESEVVCPCCSARFHRWGHQASFDEHTLRAELEACPGLSVLDCRGEMFDDPRQPRRLRLIDQLRAVKRRLFGSRHWPSLYFRAQRVLPAWRAGTRK